MSFVAPVDTLPIDEDASGALRVGDSRVLLEIVIHAYQGGATPEAIVQSFQTLSLADIYAVIAYYLRHPADVEAYMERREQQAAKIRETIEQAQPPLQELRDKVRKRRGS